jgi:outer membrane protein TolC
MVLGAASVWFGGCQSYVARPLTREALDDALVIPPLDVLASRVHTPPHPLLPALMVDASDGIDPTEAACLAVVLNPTLRAERARRGLVAAQLIQAGLLPNPQLSLSLDRPIAGATDGTVTAYGLGVGWDVGALVEHQSVVAAARAEDRAAALDLLWQEWQFACAARLAVSQAAWQQAVCRTLSGAVDEARVALEDLRGALASGNTTSLEVDAAEATLHSQIAQLRAAERSREVAMLDARRAIGFAPDAAITLASTDALVPLRDLPSLAEAFGDARETRIDLAALRAGYDAQEERVRAAVLAQFPRLNIGLNAARDTGDVRTLGVGVAIDLPIFDRAQGRIATERATRDQLFAEYTVREFALRADLAAILAELDRIDPEIEAQATYVRTVDTLLTTLRADEERQLVDIISVEQLRVAVVNARIELLTLRQRQAELGIAFETVAGHLVTGGAS